MFYFLRVAFSVVVSIVVFSGTVVFTIRGFATVKSEGAVKTNHLFPVAFPPFKDSNYLQIGAIRPSNAVRHKKLCGEPLRDLPTTSGC